MLGMAQLKRNGLNRLLFLNQSILTLLILSVVPLNLTQVVTYKLNLLIFRSGDLKTAFYRNTSV
ncbi:MAG: hypothetical protein D3917_10355 [Candidatus Electrothrix sp. AX5]|nr:hypothetical protein [Candidatus Electrothrix sp. AX5]